MGYSLVYYREIEGIAVLWYNGKNHDLPEESYKPPFGQEHIGFVITENGGQEMERNNMLEEDTVIAENTKLLPFEEIQKRLIKTLEYMVEGEYVEGTEECINAIDGSYINPNSEVLEATY